MRRSIAEGFVSVLSGLDPDPHWTVRAALASVLATLPPEVALPRLTSMLDDATSGRFPAVLAALVKLRAPNAASVLLERLKADDPVVRVAAANGIGELKPANGAAALADAYRLGQRDGTYIARGGAGGAREVRRRGRGAGAENGAGRQGLGAARPRGGAAEAARSRHRRRRAHSARADDGGAGGVSGGAARESARVHAALHRHRSRHDSDRAGGRSTRR